MSDATGYISRSGTEVSFARPGAKIVNDTLFATGTLGPLSVPADSIAEIRTQGFSPWGSLVVIGAGAAVALGLVYLALANAHGGT
jgi:type IV secretory pathway ATPase VirB11/archaellum biosynthesis ATPase